MRPFENQTLEDRIVWYEKARKENIERATNAETREERAHYLQQAALAQTVIVGLQEAAAMIGIAIKPFA